MPRLLVRHAKLIALLGTGTTLLQSGSCSATAQSVASEAILTLVNAFATAIASGALGA